LSDHHAPALRAALAGAGLAAAWLTGCASGPPAQPENRAPAPALAATWQAPLPQAGQAPARTANAAIAANAAEAAGAAAARAPIAAGALNATTTWAHFNDPLLPGLVAAAQQASPTLSAARARIERARATRAAAGAALLPSLDAVATATQGRSAPRGGATASVTLGLQTAWEIDLFGGAAAGRDAAQARLQGAQAAWAGARLAVAAETASSYLDLRACEALSVQARADAQSRGETAKLTELSVRAGFTPPADAALARAGAAQSRNQAVSQAAACDTLVKSLVELTDIAEPALRRQLAPRTALLPQPGALTLADTLPAALLSRRPDLAEAERNVIAAAGERSQTQAREKPSLSLTGSLAGGAGRASGITATGANWSFGPLVVDFPLFDGGRRAADSAAAQASYDDAVAQYRGLARRAVREVESALVALQSGSQRMDDALGAAQDFETSLRATAARQQGGLASLFDLEAARRNAVTAQSALIDLQRERAGAWISLVRALGGGWDATTLSAAATTP
jgi:NodT family efflux transporter outer membrane factor (OMF) lipoprotein